MQQASTPIDGKALERAVREGLADWRTLLTGSVAKGRSLLREVLSGPIRFTPTSDGFRFEGRVAIDRLLAGKTPFTRCPS
jgi:hypothetical protein